MCGVQWRLTAGVGLDSDAKSPFPSSPNSELSGILRGNDGETVYDYFTEDLVKQKVSP